MTIEEILPTLVVGGCVVVMPDSVMAPLDLQRLMAETGVTVANLPTSYWRQWVSEMPLVDLLSGSLRLVVIGTEKADTATLARWWRHSSVPVINSYGLCETTVSVATREFRSGELPNADTLPLESV